MRRAAIASSILFIGATAIVFGFPDFADMLDGRLYQLTVLFDKVESKVNLASAYEVLRPSKKYLFVEEGMRKEEVASICRTKFSWDDFDTRAFMGTLSCALSNDEGKFLPGGYVTDTSATPRDIKLEMKNRFEDVIREQAKENDIDVSRLDLNTVLKIASIIQREAAGKRDMNMISGIIWNRLSEDMPLQIDATLQYVKGRDGKWWPYVFSQDKYLDSPYNTYQYKGLPPTPISNPGIAAISAALDPEKTDCLFYLHDRYGRIHCSKTYDGQKKNVNRYLR